MSTLRGALKDSIAADKVEFLEKTVAAASNGFRCSPAEAWRNIKVLAAWGGRRWGAGYQPLRRDAAGKLAESPGDIANIELDHFAEVEGAVTLSPEQLCARREQHARQQQPLDGQLAVLMTRPELASSFCRASAKRKKQPGPDGVSDALLSLAPRATARVAHPLITKWAVTQVQPLALKGAFCCCCPVQKQGLQGAHGVLPLGAAGEHGR